MATQPAYPLLTADEFIQIDFGERKAELDNGVIRMMAGGTARHARVQGNIYFALAQRLRGTRCTPYNSDMAARTHDRSVRYPNLSSYYDRDGPENDSEKMFDDPRVIFEVLSAGTARTDLRTKLEEYKRLPSVDTIVFVDIAVERLRVVQRTGRARWDDDDHDEAVDLRLPSLDVTLPHAEIFARD
jgi:Uma2 family endonuclease